MSKQWSIILVKEMQDRKLSQKELSTIIGVNRYTLNRWINDHNVPSLAWRKHLERILKTEVA